MTRRSAPVLVEPPPSEAELETILRAATTVPDHGLLRPWRFVVVEGEARARFGDALVQSILQARPDSPPEAMVKARLKAFVAPLFVVLISSPRDDGKTPEWEQVVSAGLTGYAMLLAAESLGLAAGWKSSHHLDGDSLRDLLTLGPARSSSAGSTSATCRRRWRPGWTPSRVPRWTWRCGHAPVGVIRRGGQSVRRASSRAPVEDTAQ